MNAQFVAEALMSAKTGVAMLRPVQTMHAGLCILVAGCARSLYGFTSLLMIIEPWASAEDEAKHLTAAKASVCRWNDHEAFAAHNVGCLSTFQLVETSNLFRAGGAIGEGLDRAGGEVRG